jgi:hypothetical protein
MQIEFTAKGGHYPFAIYEGTADGQQFSGCPEDICEAIWRENFDTIAVKKDDAKPEQPE